MGIHDDDNLTEDRGMKLFEELISRLQGVDSDKMMEDMNMLMSILSSRRSDADIEAMKKIGMEFEILSHNLLNLADLIGRKFKIG